MIRNWHLPAIVLVLAASVAWAQSDDPPSRVARLSYTSGSVAFRPGSVEEWSDATLNYPLTTGDHLWTDPGAQSEIQTGSAAIRMASETALAFLNLNDRTAQLSITQGSVQIHIRSLDPEETFEVDTPNVAITLLRPGDYRIDADGENGLTTVTVRGGDAAVTGGGIAFPVHARETARIRGTDSVSEEVGPALAQDNFERWCDSRDRREEQSVSAQYVPREMPGYQDLDDYGSWREEADYGWVWRPRAVAVDWAPYRYGHWAWVEPWGWTWIDDAPWGFAPFHYGRWAYAGGVWVWVPGHRVIGMRPIYAPALVVFVGGPRFGISSAAWFPLGPREVYRPQYHVSDRYIRNINVTHVTNVTVINNVNITNVRYANQRAGAVTVVSHETFVGARHIGREAVRVDSRDIEQARVVGSTAAIAPRRESVLVGPSRGAPPARFAERTVVVKTAPPPQPVSFGARQRALEANPGRPLDAAQVETLRRDAPARQPMVRTVGPARPANRSNEPQPRPQIGTRDDTPRSDRPQRVQPQVSEPQTQPRNAEQPRVFGRPRENEPARNAEQPRNNERPRIQEVPRVETPRNVEQRRPEPVRTEPQRTERPRVERAPIEQPRVEQPRRVETPRETPRSQGSERRDAAEKRQEERKAERKESKKKDQ